MRIGKRAGLSAGRITVAVVVLFAVLQVLAASASAASPLNVFVGYMDTHSVPSSANQPNPWPYTDPTSFIGTPCPGYPNDIACWDASAIRLDNPGSAPVTGVSVSVDIGGHTYNLWPSNMTVKAGGMLVLTETGSSQNSQNFDGSDAPPNDYQGGNLASCVNSGAIPTVSVTIAGVTTTYLDNGQVLNGGGVDKGHCVAGNFVPARQDESHPWVLIGASTPVAPSAPRSLSAMGGDGSVSLTWTVPVSNGGAAISGYNIYRSTTPGGEGTTPVKTGVTTTSFTDAGLTNGTRYYYTVAAVNSIGTSPQSGEASATPAAVPGAPRSLAATGGQGSVKLSWSAPSSNGGSTITGYDVYRSTTPNGEAGTTPIVTNVTSTSYTDLTVTNGTGYYYTVAAVNAVGPSPQSNEASALPQTMPSAPLGLVAFADGGEVTLFWTVPNDDGGSPITGYSVFRSTTPGGEGTTVFASAVSNTYTDTAVTNGTTYYYTVAAVNGVGASAQSGEASATLPPAATVASAPTGGNGSGNHPTPPPSSAAMPTLVNPRTGTFGVRPGTIGLSGNGSFLAGAYQHGRQSRFNRHWAGRITWTTWATTQAFGSGAIWIDGCRPDCARGHYRPYLVKLWAYRVVNGHFTRLWVSERYHGRWRSFVMRLGYSNKLWSWH